MVEEGGSRGGHSSVGGAVARSVPTGDCGGGGGEAAPGLGGGATVGGDR